MTDHRARGAALARPRLWLTVAAIIAAGLAAAVALTGLAAWLLTRACVASSTEGGTGCEFAWLAVVTIGGPVMLLIGLVASGGAAWAYVRRWRERRAAPPPPHPLD